MPSGPQKVNEAVKNLEHQVTHFLSRAMDLENGAPAWKQRELLDDARAYARAVNRLTRVRK